MAFVELFAARSVGFCSKIKVGMSDGKPHLQKESCELTSLEFSSNAEGLTTSQHPNNLGGIIAPCTPACWTPLSHGRSYDIDRRNNACSTPYCTTVTPKLVVSTEIFIPDFFDESAPPATSDAAFPKEESTRNILPGASLYSSPAETLPFPLRPRSHLLCKLLASTKVQQHQQESAKQRQLNSPRAEGAHMLKTPIISSHADSTYKASTSLCRPLANQIEAKSFEARKQATRHVEFLGALGTKPCTEERRSKGICPCATSSHADSTCKASTSLCRPLANQIEAKSFEARKQATRHVEFLDMKPCTEERRSKGICPRAPSPDALPTCPVADEQHNEQMGSQPTRRCAIQRKELFYDAMHPQENSTRSAREESCLFSVFESAHLTCPQNDSLLSFLLPLGALECVSGDCLAWTKGFSREADCSYGPSLPSLEVSTECDEDTHGILMPVHSVHGSRNTNEGEQESVESDGTFCFRGNGILRRLILRPRRKEQDCLVMEYWEFLDSRRVRQRSNDLISNVIGN